MVHPGYGSPHSQLAVYYYAMLFLLVISLGLMYALANSRFGMFWRAIREDQEAAAAMGVDVVRYKLMLFVITSMIAGLAGARVWADGSSIPLSTASMTVARSDCTDVPACWDSSHKNSLHPKAKLRQLRARNVSDADRSASGEGGLLCQ